MNTNLIQQIMKSPNMEQSILQMMTPQQRQLAEEYLKNPNREEAYNLILKQYGVSQEQVDSIKQMLQR